MAFPKIGTSTRYAQDVIFPKEIEEAFKPSTALITRRVERTGRKRVQAVIYEESPIWESVGLETNFYDSVFKTINQIKSAPTSVEYKINALKELKEETLLNEILAKIELWERTLNSDEREQLKKTFLESTKVNFDICLKSLPSSFCQASTLQSTDVKAKCIYNFYLPDENDIDKYENLYNKDLVIASPRTIRKTRRGRTFNTDPTPKTALFTKNTVPKYVEVMWDQVFEKEKIEEQKIALSPEVKSIIDEYKRKRDSSRITNYVKNINYFDLDSLYDVRDNLNVDINTAEISVRNGNKLAVNNNLFKHTMSAIAVSSQGQEEFSIDNSNEPILTSRRLFLTSRGLGFALSQNEQANRISTEEQKADAYFKIADYLSNNEILSDENRPYTVSTKELVGIDYVGYVVQKERFDQNMKKWHRVSNNFVLGARNNIFRDFRIAYGQTYKYAVKCLVRVTLPFAVQQQAEDFSDIFSNQFKDGTKIEDEIIMDLIKNSEDRLSEDAMNSLELNYRFARSRELALELTPRMPFNGPVYITTYWIKKMLYYYKNGRQPSNLYGNDPQIMSRLLGFTYPTNLLDVNRKFNRVCENINNLIKDELTKREREFEQKISSLTQYRSYFYLSEPSRYPAHVSIVDRVPPDPPSILKTIINTPRKEIKILFNLPALSQRDLKSVSLYRRTITTNQEDGSISISNWELPDNTNNNLRVKDVNNQIYSAFFIDNVELHKSYIYALACQDHHGLWSFLSAQIEASLNDNYARERAELPIKFHSGPGGSLSESASIKRKNNLKINNKTVLKYNEKISISPSLMFSEAKKDIIMRVTSLDTHEVQDIKITLKQN